MKKTIIIFAFGLLGLTVVLVLLCRFDTDQSSRNEEEMNRQVGGASSGVSDDASPNTRPPVDVRDVHRREGGLSEADGVADIAGLRLPIYFEDDSLSDGLRREIELDIERLNSARNSYNIYPTPNVRTSDRVIHFSGGGIDVPDIVYDELDIVRKVGGEDHLVITKTLSDAYSEAIEFREDYQNEYDALISTIDRINRTRPEDVTEENALEIMPFPSDGKLSPRLQMEIVANNLKAAEYGFPSILDLQMRDPFEFGIDPKSIPSGELLSSVVYAKIMESDSYYPILFFWDETRWIAAVVVP